MLLALVLVVMAVAPAAAQGPDVGAAQSVHAGFCLNPNSNTVASTGCPVGVAQIIPSSGTAVTEVTVADVDNLGSVQIAFDYDSDIVQVKDVRPGSLFDNLTMGVDYTIDKSKIGGFGAPLNINPPFAEPALSCGGGDCWRSYIFITIYNWATERVPLNGNGSLIRIYWNVQPAALGAATPLQFPILSMANKSGSSIWPCFPTDGVTPNPYCGPVPMPVLATNAAPVGNLQIGSPSAAGLQFQVALEGGKLPGDGDPNCNFPSTWTLPPPAPPSGLCLNDVSVVAGVFVAVADMQGNIAIPYAAAYPTVTASRPGYLTARAVNLMPGADLGSVQLMAGDVTGDNVVNIFDLTVVAGSLGAPVGNSTALETMDFNGDGVVTIADLALVAKNYNMNGPRPITVIP
jgi:hypothetical protein